MLTNDAFPTLIAITPEEVDIVISILESTIRSRWFNNCDNRTRKTVLRMYEQLLNHSGTLKGVK